MKQYPQKYLPLIVGAACAFGILLGSFFNFPSHKKDLLTSNSNKKKLEKLIDYIDYDYVDKVNTDSIVDVTISSILKDLDPHSTYIPRDALPGVTEEMEGDFVGIGIQFFQVKDSVAVVRTIKGGPSDKAGIEAGDRLVYADNHPLYGNEFNFNSLKDLLRGDPESIVNLKVKRPGQKDLLDFEVTRQHIPLESVDAGFMVNEEVAYIRVNRFSKNTYQEFIKVIEDLSVENKKSLILDLRGNGGGYLNEAIKVADEFLKEGALIVFTKDNKGKIKKTYATSGGKLENLPVYVLIDQHSASASEVVAGALQDNDVGTIVGRRSFGKGLVQREMGLGDGSVIRLTVSRYYTPTGRSIQKPYTNENPSDYYHDFIDRYKNGELVNKDSIKLNDSLKFVTPKGKIVYGGGGIVPDVFVPMDVSYRKESLDYMLKGGMLDRFVFDYLDKERNYFNNLSQQEFMEQVQVDEQMLKEFAEFLQEFKLSFRSRQYRDLLKTYLKASMARQLFDNNLYQKIINAQDPNIEKVLELYQLNQNELNVP